MKTRMLLLFIGFWLLSSLTFADEIVTVAATSTDISENLDLKTVATLFGQAKNLEEFEQLLNHPDSAFSNLDLNGDGQVDYLRVMESSEIDKRLVVIQAVLAKDVFQDVASIMVEQDPLTQKVSVQIVGDAYIYGKNYIIEPVYIYRPAIYDWFWGPGWGCCWSSPWYWGYWPGWWRPVYCVDAYWYWNRCYGYHYVYPICSYRTGYVEFAGYTKMRSSVSRSDYAQANPERAFSSRQQSYQNARSLESQRRASLSSGVSRSAANANSLSAGASTRSTAVHSATSAPTYGSSLVRSSAASSATRVSAGTSSSRTSSSASSARTSSTSTSSSRSTTASSARPVSTATTRSSAAATAITMSSARSSSSSSSTSSRTSSSSRTATSSAPRTSSVGSYSGNYSGSTSGSYSGGAGGSYSGGAGGSHSSGAGASTRSGGGSTRR